MSLTKKTDYIEQGLDRLLEQYKNKPRLQGLIEPWLGWIQKLEDAVWEVITLRYLETGSGAQLDILGKILGAPRANLSDENYRVRLKAQGIILRTKGNPVDIESLLQLCSPYDFAVTEHAIATLLVELTEPVDVDTFDIFVLWQILIEAKAGGVRLELTYSPNLDDDDLTFAEWSADYSTPVFDTDHGLGYTDDATVGGLLISTISQ